MSSAWRLPGPARPCARRIRGTTGAGPLGSATAWECVRSRSACWSTKPLSCLQGTPWRWRNSVACGSRAGGGPPRGRGRNRRPSRSSQRRAWRGTSGAPAPVPADLVGPEKCPREVRAGLQQPERAARRGVAPPTAGRRAGRERGPERRELMSSDATSRRRAAARPTCLARGADGGNCCRGITIEGRCETA